MVRIAGFEPLIGSLSDGPFVPVLPMFQYKVRERNMSDIIKVSANSMTTAVAGAIAGVIRDHGQADVQAIGASAVNQAV